MTHSTIPVQEIENIICKDFQIEKSERMKTIEEIKIELSKIISQLLNTDLNQLLNIFYRIDLNEKEVDKILTQEKPEDISPKLADLVLNREIEKVKTRLKYR